MRRFITMLIAACTALSLQAQSILTIEECRNLALEHNRSLMISQEKANIATETRKSVFTQFLPNFSANGTYIRNEKNISLLSEDALLPIGTKLSDGSFGFRQDQISNQWVKVSDGVYAPLDSDGVPFDPKVNPEKIIWKDYALLPKEAMEFDTKNIYAGTVGFIQPLFLGGKIRELYKMSRSAEAVAKLENEKAIDDLIVEVDEAYWRVVSIENKTKLAKEYCNLMTKLEGNVKVMIEEGVATKADLLRVMVKKNEAEMILAKAENGLQLSKMALNQLCGLEMNKEIILSESNLETIEDVLPINGSIESMINNRFEMKALAEAKNIAGSSYKIAQSRFMPNLVLSGNYIISNPNVYNGYSNKFAGMYSFGLVLNVPIFHFGDRVHTLKAAKSEMKIAGLQIEEAKEKIELQINQSKFKIDEAKRKLKIADKSVEQANENLKFANEAFEAGIVSSTDLMTAQTAWLSASSENIDSKIEVKLCELYLKKALGKSLEK
ncbi:MAG: TolC family protein [Rikenellaceae bacterium]|nr:TolC family protein [Rikenellaceae bacterium]